MRSSRGIRAEIPVLIVSSVLILLRVLPFLKTSVSRAEEIFSESGVVNLATSVYLFQRLYDTVFEVLVFSVVVSSLHLPRRGNVGEIDDEVFRDVARFSAFFVGVASVYIAATGHVYPGGGFTAGVMGGTALLLMGVARGVKRFSEEFERMKVPLVEKFLMSAMVVSALLTIQLGRTDLIQMMNFLIYFKVMAGTWIITHEFTVHRGIV